LAAVLADSPGLPEALGAGIVAMVRAASREGHDAAVRPVASYAPPGAFPASGDSIVLASASGIAKNNPRVLSVAVSVP
jgi:hypothetical protein